ncbi:MAG: cytochrome d ubiquinol oxidase subunit II [Selenomonadaceae bacterium]|nr:cytochrome d ubiquinol oxidase subunit II [Selenomonadaceae bacterium]
MEILNIVWFVLITVLFTGFFILEGFDYGVGMLLIGKNDEERSMLIRSIGPVWDGNEVWMITAGGALFAAFPHVYATMFSTFYIALFLMLMALILRGVAFELRGKHPSSDWRKLWDWAIIFGSTVPAILWGVAMTNLLKGLPIDSQMHYLGGFFDLLSPYTLLAGITFAAIFLYHGANFLMLKLGDGRLLLNIKTKAFKFGIIALLLGVAFIAATVISFGVSAGLTPIFIGAACLIYSICSFKRECFKCSFIASTLSIAAITVGLFTALFPNLMISSLNPEWSLNIYNAASTPHTLAIMTGAAVVLVPIVLIYQGWTYRIFKERITVNDLQH